MTRAAQPASYGDRFRAKMAGCNAGDPMASIGQDQLLRPVKKSTGYK